MKTIIMKFGGASLKNVNDFYNICTLIQEKKSFYLVVVVSAMGELTDELISLAHQVSECPVKRELDMLLSAGERVSMSLLAIALKEKGIDAISLTGSQSGIITSEHHGEALIREMRPIRVKQHLAEGKVVIVGGFQGVSHTKEVTTLGRGGSDTSAVALGVALQAERVEFYKDVAGVFSKDPKHDPQAAFVPDMTFEQALSFSEFILHKRAIKLALINGLPLLVQSFKKDLRDQFFGTWIGANAVRLDQRYEDFY